MRSDQVGAGLCEFPHRNFEIFGFGGTIWTNGFSHRLAMAMGVLECSRGRQTTYSISRTTFLEGILAI
jgi:hypothetical protein